jgi:PKD repeat protein
VVETLLPTSAVSARRRAYPTPLVTITTNPGGTGQSGSPAVVTVPLSTSVSFTASPAEGRDLTYSWDFGDGHTASGANVTHQYTTDSYTTTQQNNAFAVTLMASDPLQQTDTEFVYVSVLPPPPQASFTASQDPNSPDCYDFDASASTGYQLSYYWDFGDGSTDNSGNSTPYHCYFYDPAGSYTVTLTVTDGLSSLDSNQQDRSSSTSHTVYNPGY